VSISTERMQERSLAAAAATQGSTTHSTGHNWEKLGTVKSSSSVRRQKNVSIWKCAPINSPQQMGLVIRGEGSVSPHSLSVLILIEFLISDSQIELLEIYLAGYL